jgi:hypothetical protein
MVGHGVGSGLAAKGSGITSGGFHNKPAGDPDGRTEVAGAWLTFQAIGELAVSAGIGPAPSAHHEKGDSLIDYLAAPALPACDRNLLRISATIMGQMCKRQCVKRYSVVMYMSTYMRLFGCIFGCS